MAHMHQRPALAIIKGFTEKERGCPVALKVKEMFLSFFTNKICLSVLLKVTEKTEEGEKQGRKKEKRKLAPVLGKMTPCLWKMF